MINELSIIHYRYDCLKKSYPCSLKTSNPSHKRLQNESFPAQYIIPKIGIEPYIIPLRKYLQRDMVQSTTNSLIVNRVKSK